METKKPARKRDTEDQRREGLVSEVEGFNERGRRAAEDRQLHEAVETFSKNVVSSRNAALNALPDAPELRESLPHKAGDHGEPGPLPGADGRRRRGAGW